MTKNLPSIFVKPKDTSALSKLQKKFNTLIKTIERNRTRLLLWKSNLPEYRQKHATEFTPRLEIYNKNQANMINLLDKNYDEKYFNKTEKTKIKNIILYLLDKLTKKIEDYDLKEIYNKYNKSNFDQDMLREKQALREIFLDDFNIDIGDEFNINSPFEVMENIAGLMAEKEEQNESENKQKSARERSYERKKTAEAQEASLSIREVYRKLAAKLHPDLEQDINERAHKNELMQRINLAYKEQDLLQLLELQLETEQINKASLSEMSNDRLKTFNRILSEQLQSLKIELDQVEFSFKIIFNINEYRPIKPEFLINTLEKATEEIKHKSWILEQDLELLQDKKALKYWLKNQSL